MAKARAIVKRRNAVTNIRKITQTMQLIATARFQKCLQRATAGQPYTNAISDMVRTLSGQQVEHPLLKANEGASKSVLLVITSNRGLCGAYNASALRTALAHRRRLVNDGIQPELSMVGKKGINYARFLKHDLAATITDVEDQIAYERVSEMAGEYMDAYIAGDIARVDIAYTQFISTSSQRSLIAQLLPIEPPSKDDGADEHSAALPDFEYLPEPVELMGRLIPETVRIRLYQYFNEAILSEQVSRMMAMKSATDAAGDMIKFLSQRYNRARQTQITMDLLDIVGGAEAIA